MTPQMTLANDAYADLFRELQGSSAQPTWMKLARERAYERFEQKGIPTTDDEEWKYTNLAPFAANNYAAARNENKQLDLSAFLYREAAESRIVFVNGHLRPELSHDANLPAGVLIADLFAAMNAPQCAAHIREKFDVLATDRESGLTSLNTALFAGGAFIHVPANVKVAAPIHVLYIADASSPTINSPRVLVSLETCAEATLVESYHCPQEVSAPYWTNAVTEVHVAEGARLTYHKVQQESMQALHTAMTRVHLLRNGRFDATSITLGARVSRHDIGVKLDHEAAECWVDGLYLVGDAQHADTHSVIDHVSPHCTSHQIYKGILDGRSRAVFNGKVFVHRDARQTDAQQTNKNLLLSREARVDTKPQLEIYNDDVKCAHGATVGQLEEEELFYLLSRGLHEKIARNLLTYGFAAEIVAKIGLESIRAQLDEAILHRIHARLEA